MYDCIIIKTQFLLPGGRPSVVTSLLEFLLNFQLFIHIIFAT